MPKRVYSKRPKLGPRPPGPWDSSPGRVAPLRPDDGSGERFGPLLLVHDGGEAWRVYNELTGITHRTYGNADDVRARLAKQGAEWQLRRSTPDITVVGYATRGGQKHLASIRRGSRRRGARKRKGEEDAETDD